MKALSTLALSAPVTKVRFLAARPSLVAVCEDNSVHLANIRDFSQLELLKSDRLPGVADIGFHPGRDELVVSTRSNGIEIRTLEDFGLIRTIGQSPSYGALLISADGESVISPCWYPYGKPSGSRTEILNYLSGSLQETTWHTDTALQHHPSHAIIAGFANDQGGCQVRFFSYADRVRSYKCALGSGMTGEGLAFSPDGNSLAMIGGPICLAFELFSFPAFQRRFSRMFQLIDDAGAVTVKSASIVFSGDSSSVFCPFPTGYIVEYDALTGAEHTRWCAHKGQVTTLDRGGSHESLLISGGEDGKIVLWDTERSQPANMRVTNPIGSKFFSDEWINSESHPVFEIVNDSDEDLTLDALPGSGDGSSKPR